MPPDSTQPALASPPSSKRLTAWGSLAILIALIVLISFFAFYTNRSAKQLSKAAPAIVNVTANGFSPAIVSVKVNQAVLWANIDSQMHLVASDNPKPVFTSKEPLKSGDSFSFVFSKAGRYAYHDNFNTSLAGIVVVQ